MLGGGDAGVSDASFTPWQACSPKSRQLPHRAQTPKDRRNSASHAPVISYRTLGGGDAGVSDASFPLPRPLEQRQKTAPRALSGYVTESPTPRPKLNGFPRPLAFVRCVSVINIVIGSLWCYQLYFFSHWRQAIVPGCSGIILGRDIFFSIGTLCTF